MLKKIYLTLFLVCLGIGISLAQTKKVSGTVKDASTNEGIPGVSVLVKGTSTGTTTDINGVYSLDTPPNAVLIFQSLSMVTQEIAVGNQSVIDVNMSADVIGLKEVVVTGYGDKSQTTFAGAASGINTKAIEGVPLASFDQMLQGQAPGLSILSSSGQPGNGNTNIVIRGIGSFGNNNPLVVLDGVPISSAVLSTINPNDFESVNVLKDASAASVYGSRGANGVIVVTSKKGKTGKTQFSYNFQQGINRAPFNNRLPIMNTNEKVDMELKAIAYNSSWTAPLGLTVSGMTPAEIAELRTIETDWRRVLFNDAASSRMHEINASGGNDKTTFYVSAGLFSQEGTVKNTNLNRYTLRTNIEHTSGNFKINTNLSLGYSRSNTTVEQDPVVSTPLNAVRWLNPYDQPFDANGEFIPFYPISFAANPLQDITLNKRRNDQIKAIGGVTLQYNAPFLKGLSFRNNSGIDYTQIDNVSYTDQATYVGSAAATRGQRGSLDNFTDRRIRLINTLSANYSKTFNDIHNISAGIYYEFIYNQFNDFGATAYGFSGGRILTVDGSTPGSQTGANFIPQLRGNRTENALASAFIDASYTYDNKYTVNAGFRRDGSSKFGQNKRYGNFYSIGLSWAVTEEKFMESISAINTLKLRGSYGILGNQAPLGDFARLANYANASYGGVSGFIPANSPNPNLQWEQGAKLNVGVDFGFFKNRITGSVDYYNNLTTNALFSTQVSRTTGFSSLIDNVASIRNRGIEVAINTINVDYKGFRWETNLNFSYNKNTVMSLSNGQDLIVEAGSSTALKVGYPINTFYAVPYLGVNPATGDARFQNLDGSESNSTALSQRRLLGSANSPYYGGITNTISYNGLSLSCLFVYFYGNQIYNSDRENLEQPSYIVSNVSREMLTAWTGAGQITNIPRLDFAYPHTQISTTRYIEDGHFIRLRNIRLSYQIPASRLGAGKYIRNANVFIQGQNILTFTNYRGQDPEIGGTPADLGVGTQQGQYPQPIIYTMGFSLGF
ncbi:MAG: SusC/RagA family TonB-linked outer membrane protein [Bacteroidetes bacterium]|nr:MAG: SusC/RagA family TonB-linked outer membrane protein [Bacteroidota bacterium]TAG88025.1 MAG: SusC/RagA family TonB-linked outer membrane protein [Bacteroidota bacterium]